jgi:hypothetical protein
MQKQIVTDCVLGKIAGYLLYHESRILAIIDKEWNCLCKSQIFLKLSYPTLRQIHDYVKMIKNGEMIPTQNGKIVCKNFQTEIFQATPSKFLFVKEFRSPYHFRRVLTVTEHYVLGYDWKSSICAYFFNDGTRWENQEYYKEWELQPSQVLLSWCAMLPNGIWIYIRKLSNNFKNIRDFSICNQKSNFIFIADNKLQKQITIVKLYKNEIYCFYSKGMLVFNLDTEKCERNVHFSEIPLGLHSKNILFFKNNLFIWDTIHLFVYSLMGILICKSKEISSSSFNSSCLSTDGLYLYLFLKTHIGELRVKTFIF